MIRFQVALPATSESESGCPWVVARAEQLAHAPGLVGVARRSRGHGNLGRPRPGVPGPTRYPAYAQ
jgi:hypothetical protein